MPDLLKRADIEAVDLVLPIEVLPPAIDLALAAGKHVISEKPIAPEVVAARRLINIYRNHPQQVWMVGENLRYEPSFRRAGEIVASGEIGRVMTAQWSLFSPRRPDNPYYWTEWRQKGAFQGGYLLDGGVHHVAALRQALGEITSVSAEVRQMMPDLPPADTLSAVFQFASGVIGSYTVTYAAGSPFPTYLTIVGECGVIRTSISSVEIASDGQVRSEDYSGTNNVQEELAAFADAVRAGKSHRNSPLEAIRDLAVIEAMLKSAESGSRVYVESFTDLEKA